MGRRWTDEERAILQKHYPMLTEQDWDELLPGRTWEAIKEVARLMGVKLGRRTRKPRCWIDRTPEELERICAEMRELRYAEAGHDDDLPGVRIVSVTGIVADDYEDETENSEADEIFVEAEENGRSIAMW